MIWKEKNKNLGSIKVGERLTITYSYSGEEKEILKLQSSCGCATPKHQIESKKIIVTFTAKPIPNHLQGLGWYDVVKNVRVFYADGTEDKLTFKARIYK